MSLTIFQLAAVLLVLAACVTDMRTRRIPNVLTLGAAAVGIVTALWLGGGHGLVRSVAGWVVGLAVFLPLFLLRGLGGGDVKLLAAVGAWLGPVAVLWVAVCAALAGGPLALMVAVSRGRVREVFANIWALLTFWRVAGLRPHPVLVLGGPSARLPYAVPIAAGLVVTLWLR